MTQPCVSVPWAYVCGVVKFDVILFKNGSELYRDTYSGTISEQSFWVQSNTQQTLRQNELIIGLKAHFIVSPPTIMSSLSKCVSQNYELVKSQNELT